MYIAPDEYWLFEGIKSLRDIDPLRLERLIELASNEVDEYCSTRFEQAEDSYSLDFCRQLHVRRRPLLEVTELLLNGALLVEGADFCVYPDCSKVEINSEYKGDRKKALEISYTYGYKVVPATVKQVIVSLIRLDIESGNVPAVGLQSESWDSEYTYSKFSSKDMTASELRKGILARLDVFKVLPLQQKQKNEAVRARLI